VVCFDLPLDHRHPLGDRRCRLTDGPGWAALEQPGAELALLGPGQLHHVAGIVGRPLDEGQGLQHRVVHVGGHLGPLLGQGPGLALRHQVTQ